MAAKTKKSAADTAIKRPKVGIAFGGGGIKGAAHVGILKVLEEYNIPIDMVAGTSIGAAVAALLASGYNSSKMELIFKEIDFGSLVKVRPSRKGLIPADGYTKLIYTCTKGLKIEEMPIPLKIVAVDLISWKKIIFDSGDTASAVRASSSLPGIFTPVKMGDMLLVDGYLLDNCPGGVVRDMGADIVIAISLFAPNYNEPENMLDIINRSIDIAAGSKQSIDADFIFRPIDAYVNTLNQERIGECLKKGEEAARSRIDELLKLLKDKGLAIEKKK